MIWLPNRSDFEQSLKPNVCSDFGHSLYMKLTIVMFVQNEIWAVFKSNEKKHQNKVFCKINFTLKLNRFYCNYFQIIKEACFDKHDIEILTTCAQVLTTSNKNTTSPSSMSPAWPSLPSPLPSLSSSATESFPEESSSAKIPLNAFAIDSTTLGLKTSARTGESSQFAPKYSGGVGSQSVSKTDKERQLNESVGVGGSVDGLEFISSEGLAIDERIAVKDSKTSDSSMLPDRSSWELPGSEISVKARLVGQLIGLKIDLTSSDAVSEEKVTEKSKLISNFPDTFTVTVPAIFDLKTKQIKEKQIKQDNDGNGTQTCSKSILSLK